MKQNRRSRKYPATRMVLLGFLCAILIGTLLFVLPVSTKDRNGLAPEDALFMAATSVCVTGLTTVSIAEELSVFGQAVVLLLIQFGGLGIVTFTTSALFLLRRKISLRERMLIQDAYNLDTMNGLAALTKRILKGTLLVEAFGAVLYAIVFVPRADSVLQGIWQSVFNAVSAFCNAGMDLLGNSSLAIYRDNPLINLNTVLLIILGGIGFPVWWNLLEVLALRKKGELSRGKIKRTVTLHTKVVLLATAVLLLLGTGLTLLFEWNNPATLAELNVFEKIQAAFFQSVTTRTAGFYTIPQEKFTSASSFVYLLLMFIGGSPSGTAGGVKTATIVMLLISTISIMRGKEDVEIFGRRICEQSLKKALTVVMVSITALITATVLLTYVQQSDFLDTLYETTSALATVGLTRNFTGQLNTAGKLIITLCMYLGRVGPISMALAFNISSLGGGRKLPEGKLMIG